MAAERKIIRIFADVVPGFDPFSIGWTSPAYASSVTPMEGAKRLWVELEIPADHEIWPEPYRAGIKVGQPGQRRIQMSDDSTRPPPTIERTRTPRPERRPQAEPIPAQADEDVDW